MFTMIQSCFNALNSELLTILFEFVKIGDNFWQKVA